MNLLNNNNNSEKNLIPFWKNQKIDDNIEKFTDSLFPPNDNSILGKNENGEYIDKINGEKKANKLRKLSIKWLRPNDIFKNEKYFLFNDKSNINISSIKQGNIADCYFISSIIGLAKVPNLINNLFKIKEINSKGYYEVILFIDGQFQIVIIDDYLPIINDNEFCFSPSINNEIWLCLLEKAWAKVNGGYANIIKGYAHHVFETLTGFPSLKLMHSSYEDSYIWEYIINSCKSRYIITSTSKDNLKEKGIENNHSYTLIDYYELKDNNKKYKIFKLRDPHANKIVFEKSKENFMIVENLMKLDIKEEDGILYISFDDYCKYFSFTNVCYFIENSYSKKIKIEGNEVHKGNIFNIYLKEDGILSINLIKKNWIFNREAKKSLLPSFIYMIKYNPENNANYYHNFVKDDNDNPFFTDFYSNISSEDNVSINKNLKSGYYLLYSFINYNQFQTSKDHFYYYIKIDSNIAFQFIKKPCDIKQNDFPVLKYIKIQEYLYINMNKNYSKEKGINYLIKYKNNDLAMKIVYNCNNKWLKITEDYSEMKNTFILSPTKIESDNKVFNWYIPPKKFNILLGMVIDSSKEGSLNLKSKNYLINTIPLNYKDYSITITQYANNIFS